MFTDCHRRRRRAAIRRRPSGLLLGSILASALIASNLQGFHLQPWSVDSAAIETISMVAFSGGLNVVFILTHHLVRMVVLHFAPALLVQARRWREEV